VSDLLLIIPVLVMFVAILYFLGRRMEARGGMLFTGRVTPGSRLLALLLGLVFAGITVVTSTSPTDIPIVFPLLAFALFAYAIGAGGLLKKIQGGNREPVPTAQVMRYELEPPPSPTEMAVYYGMPTKEQQRRKRRDALLKPFIRLGILIAVLAGLLFATFWILAHPDELLSEILLFGIVTLFFLLIVLDRIRSVFEIADIIKKLFIAVLAGLTFASFWILAHPDELLSEILLFGIVALFCLLFVLSRISLVFEIADIIKKLFKK
jgi:hypothetical protein